MGDGPATIPIEDPAYWQDPHTTLRAARERHPVAIASTGEPIVLRYDDVERLASDHRNVSNALAFVERQVDEGPLVDWWRLMLTNLNGPDHRRLRSLVNRAFTPRSADAKRERIRSLTDELLAPHLEAGELLELYLWASDDGPQPPVAAREEKVAQEAADVGICLLNFCERAGIDLLAAMADKIEANELRYPVDRARGRLEKAEEL